jgi:GT2 family glycosyltransferase
MIEPAREPPPGPALSVSIVVFQSDLGLLRSTLASLRAALELARNRSAIGSALLVLVDNGTADEAALDALMATMAEGPCWLEARLLRGHGNIGYGRGHNLAIAQGAGAYHLVLNPDVELDPGAILEAVRYLEAQPETGMITPHVSNEAGSREFLCKREPSVLVLGLRGFAPGWLRRPFRRLLDRYEMRDLPEHAIVGGIPIASGCFMFARRRVLEALGGFSPEYFLYFEDFDLSLRFRRLADIAYVPQVRIVHRGGYAARKGWKHRRLFLRSAVRYFHRQGWRFW